MSENYETYKSPRTIAAFLLSTGMSKRALCLYAGIDFRALLNMERNPHFRPGFATQVKLEREYERYMEEQRQDAEFRKEHGL